MEPFIDYTYFCLPRDHGSVLAHRWSHCVTGITLPPVDANELFPFFFFHCLLAAGEESRKKQDSSLLIPFCFPFVFLLSVAFCEINSINLFRESKTFIENPSCRCRSRALVAIFSRFVTAKLTFSSEDMMNIHHRGVRIEALLPTSQLMLHHLPM
jgi:hypothetical protein